MPTYLNIGCGYDVRPGWTNLDRAALPGVDVVHDIAKLPLPFPADNFDFILCQDVLEHFDAATLLFELWRILKERGKLHIRVPHFTSAAAYGDPTHKSYYSSGTFAFFVKGGNDRPYYFDRAYSRMENLRIHFGPKLYRPIEWLVNTTPRMQWIYESSPLRIFPAANIEVDLIK
jgi:SAM-dependent methyltransferase